MVIFFKTEADKILALSDKVKQMLTRAIAGGEKVVGEIGDMVVNLLQGDALRLTFDGLAALLPGVKELPGTIKKLMQDLKEKAKWPLEKLVELFAPPVKAVLDGIRKALGIKDEVEIVAGPVKEGKTEAWAEVSHGWKPDTFERDSEFPDVDFSIKIYVHSSPTRLVSPLCSEKAKAAQTSVRAYLKELLEAVKQKDAKSSPGDGRKTSDRIKTYKTKSDNDLEAVAKEQSGDCKSGLCVVDRDPMQQKKVGKTVIFGTAQDPHGSNGKHARVVENLANELAVSGTYEYIVLNRAWRTATARAMTSDDRPDIIAVRCNGKVDAWEVQSDPKNDPGQLEVNLRAKMEKAYQSAPSLKGDTDVIELPYPAKYLK